MDDNAIADAGGARLAASLPKNKTLGVLSLQKNRLGEDAKRFLSERALEPLKLML
jgi:hypothetical protein